MLLDNKQHFVELMVDNLMWGNITIDWENAIDDDEYGEEAFHIQLSDYIRYSRKRRKESKPTTEETQLIEDLAFHFEVRRVFGNIKGVLKDNELENKVEELTKNNEKLVTIIDEQKAKLDQLISRATDTKNIRGIG